MEAGQGEREKGGGCALGGVSASRFGDRGRRGRLRFSGSALSRSLLLRAGLCYLAAMATVSTAPSFASNYSDILHRRRPDSTH